MMLFKADNSGNITFIKKLGDNNKKTETKMS